MRVAFTGAENEAAFTVAGVLHNQRIDTQTATIIATQPADLATRKKPGFEGKR